MPQTVQNAEDNTDKITYNGKQFLKYFSLPDTNLNTAISIIYLSKMINILINIITLNKMKKYLNTINYTIKSNQMIN